MSSPHLSFQFKNLYPHHHLLKFLFKTYLIRNGESGGQSELFKIQIRFCYIPSNNSMSEFILHGIYRGFISFLIVKAAASHTEIMRKDVGWFSLIGPKDETMIYWPSLMI